MLILLKQLAKVPRKVEHSRRKWLHQVNKLRPQNSFHSQTSGCNLLVLPDFERISCCNWDYICGKLLPIHGPVNDNFLENPINIRVCIDLIQEQN